MPSYRIPQKATPKDKILGPLTVRDLIYLIISSMVVYFSYIYLPKNPIFILTDTEIYITLAIEGIIGLAFTFFKYDDRTFDQWVSDFIGFIFQNKVMFWKKEGTVFSLVAPEVVIEESKDNSQMLEKAEEAHDKISRLSKLLDNPDLALSEKEKVQQLHHKEREELKEIENEMAIEEEKRKETELLEEEMMEKRMAELEKEERKDEERQKMLEFLKQKSEQQRQEKGPQDISHSSSAPARTRPAVSRARAVPSWNMGEGETEREFWGFVFGEEPVNLDFHHSYKEEKGEKKDVKILAKKEGGLKSLIQKIVNLVANFFHIQFWKSRVGPEKELEEVKKLDAGQKKKPSKRDLEDLFLESEFEKEIDKLGKGVGSVVDLKNKKEDQTEAEKSRFDQANLSPNDIVKELSELKKRRRGK